MVALSSTVGTSTPFFAFPSWIISRLCEDPLPHRGKNSILYFAHVIFLISHFSLLKTVLEVASVTITPCVTGSGEG